MPECELAALRVCVAALLRIEKYAENVNCCNYKVEFIAPISANVRAALEAAESLVPGISTGERKAE